MLYWRDRYFRDLKEAATEAGRLGWSGYADYCLEQEKGLRPSALGILDKFIQFTARASVSERRRFVSWLFSFADERQGRDLLIPYPLRKQIIEPTLHEWVQDEPDCPEPHRWLGGRDHLERALDLNPADQVARKKLVVHLLWRVVNATHELPLGYLGSPHDDLLLLDKVDALLSGLEDEEARGAYAQTVSEEREAIKQFLNRSKEP